MVIDNEKGKLLLYFDAADAFQTYFKILWDGMCCCYHISLKMENLATEDKR